MLIFGYCYEIKIIHKNHRLNTWKRTKCLGFLKQNFFSVLQNTYERNESHALENCHVKILVLETESENGKNILDQNPKLLIRIHNTLCIILLDP
jgi:hypothetical protein